MFYSRFCFGLWYRNAFVRELNGEIIYDNSKLEIGTDLLAFSSRAQNNDFNSIAITVFTYTQRKKQKNVHAIACDDLFAGFLLSHSNSVSVSIFLRFQVFVFPFSLCLSSFYYFLCFCFKLNSITKSYAYLHNYLLLNFRYVFFCFIFFRLTSNFFLLLF